MSERIIRAGEIGGGYLLMIAISAAIAVLGLLLSSPAVVIGAMLLSPLMGPIILLGFSFWMVDWNSTRKALVSLGVGFGLALFVSIALTAISPLKEPTAEILARTRPNLFDLLVAVFSDLAGGYAVVRHRGEAVIGVAIATALMPPLAVVGFSIGTRAWALAGGALLLFFTNLIAIALAAAVVAAISGFRPRVHLAQWGWLHHLGVALILAALCAPLTLSLHTIALESRATTATRSEISRLFGRNARIASLSVRSGKGGIEEDGLVATRAYIDDAASRIEADLRKDLHAKVNVHLDQVVLADPSKLKALPAEPPPDLAAAASASLRAAVPFPDTTTSYDPASSMGLVLLGPQSGLDLTGARALENALRTKAEFGKTTVVPAIVLPLPIPLILPAKGTPSLGDSTLPQWALARWRAGGLSATICRNGHRGIRDRDMQAALAARFAPLPVVIAQGTAGCAAAGSSPHIMVAPAELAQPLATAPTLQPGVTAH